MLNVSEIIPTCKQFMHALSAVKQHSSENPPGRPRSVPTGPAVYPQVPGLAPRVTHLAGERSLPRVFADVAHKSSRSRLDNPTVATSPVGPLGRKDRKAIRGIVKVLCLPLSHCAIEN